MSDMQLIFDSQTGLELSAQTDSWLMDGMFDAAPKQCAQLFIICVPYLLCMGFSRQTIFIRRNPTFPYTEGPIL
ncbi:hypothetical protein DPMN_042773 [Dreissena polymorpha]|uniref:Uncharacterized protein n=1 Tax=Dreissena polymorpha TaxID=45954 RepID=A0A9D4HV11_DREPO|nr:hypothetical protein DPMN_042773 [Dreissena polymorpha]